MVFHSICYSLLGRYLPCDAICPYKLHFFIGGALMLYTLQLLRLVGIRVMVGLICSELVCYAS